MSRDRTSADLGNHRTGEPWRDLDRDGLIALVGELQATIARQAETIARQRTAIAALQGRPESPAADPAAAPPRPPARPVAGADYTIVFDGGAIGNPGRGYGSYQIVGSGGLVAERRLEYGDDVTNNQAEYRTLIHALTDLRDRLGDAAAATVVAVRGDSQLVINTVTGRWKVRHPDLQPLHRQAVELLGAFGRTDVAWHRRGSSVRVLGH